MFRLRPRVDDSVVTPWWRVIFPSRAMGSFLRKIHMPLPHHHHVYAACCTRSLWWCPSFITEGRTWGQSFQLFVSLIVSYRETVVNVGAVAFCQRWVWSYLGGSRDITWIYREACCRAVKAGVLLYPQHWSRLNFLGLSVLGLSPYNCQGVFPICTCGLWRRLFLFLWGCELVCCQFVHSLIAVLLTCFVDDYYLSYFGISPKLCTK